MFIYLCDYMFNLNKFYMKKQLRNLALATAVAVAGSASAQTLGLTKVWEHDVASAGTPTSGDARFGTGYGDKVYTVDKAAKTLIAWDANGASNVLTNDAFVGTCVTTDDAGNVLISSAFAGAGAATGWSIISASDNSVTPLTVTMPEDAPAARIDQVGRVVGNVLSEEGGYLYLWCSSNSTVAVIKIVNGVQDEASTYASIAIDAATTSCIAQPALATVAEIDELADPSASFYFRNRLDQTVKGFNEDGTEVVSYTTPAADATDANLKARSCEGFDVFTLNGVTYCVHPYDDVNYGPGFAVAELATGNIIDIRTSDYNPGGQRYQSIVARVNDDGTASIFQYVSGSVAALYTFGPKSEPESYKFGYVKNVTSGEKYLFAASDSIIATALADTKTFGYLGCDTLTNEEGYLTTLDAVNAFTITAVEGGYTIQDSYGRYLYQTGTYNSFNVAAELPAEGGVWTIEAQEDGTVKVTNVAVSKWMQFSTGYSSWGSYNTENGLCPALFQLGATAEEKPVVTVKTEVANIAEFIENADLANAVTITGTVTVVAQSGSYLFLQDESGRMVAYGSSLPAYNNGDQLTGIKGTWKPYNGLPQMNPDVTTFGTATAGTPVEPTEMTLEEVAIDNLLAYIKVVGVTIPESDSYSYTINDGTIDMTMYNSLKITVPTGSDLTVEGFISCYNTTVQVMPLNITSSTGLEVVQAPEISPASGAITATQDITITCATEGASIYFTVDGTEPSETNGTLYSTPFVLGMEATVKAIAVKEGMANSAVVEATYTLLSETTKQVTFDFTAPSSLNPAQEELAFGQSLAIPVNDIVFTAGVNNEISISFAKNSASTDCRIWAGTSAYDLRTYSTSTFTIAGTNAKILGIEFTGSKVSADTYLTADSGTFAEKAWSGEAVSVTFTTVKTTNIGTITVTYNLDGSGIEGVEVEENAPAVYYNLQGVQVANPEAGIYIKVQGGKASKVLVR